MKKSKYANIFLHQTPPEHQASMFGFGPKLVRGSGPTPSPPKPSTVPFLSVPEFGVEGFLLEDNTFPGGRPLYKNLSMSTFLDFLWR